MEELAHNILPCALLGLLASVLLFGVIRRVCDSAFVAGRETQFHHHHGSKTRIPRVGGICIVGGFIAVCLLAGFMHHFGPMATKRFWVIAGSALAMFTVGIIDDLRPLGAKRKLVLQIVIASFAYWLGVQINQFRNPLSGQIFSLGAGGYVVTVVWLVAMTNLINLIDGIDGLAGGIGIMLMGLLAWAGFSIENGFYSLICVGVIGALLGFLRFNFPPAKIYMGDGGAYFLGFLVGLISIETSHKGTVVAALTAPALALALPILDTTLALLRRAMKGLPLFRPDLEHIHHKLVKRGVTRTRAVLILYLFSVLSLCIAIGVFMLSGMQLPIFIGLAALVLIVLLRVLNVIPNFLTLGSVLQRNWNLRWRSRYILAMSSWLQMEAEQCQTVLELWNSYTFFQKKLGLSQVKVSLGGIEKNWESTGHSGALWRRRHQFWIDQEMAIEFFCREGDLTRPEFDHVSELAAEAWLKAVTRWEQVHRKKANLAYEEPLPAKKSGLEGVGPLLTSSIQTT